jgi:hypothetical protein
MKKTIVIYALFILLGAFIVLSFTPNRREYIPTITASGTLDFPNTAAGTSNDLTITATGAAVGDMVLIGVPDAATAANGFFVAWVSAANTVTVRFLNNALLTGYNPASAAFKLIIWKNN